MGEYDPCLNDALPTTVHLTESSHNGRFTQWGEICPAGLLKGKHAFG